MTLRPSLTGLTGLAGLVLTAIAGCAPLEPDVGRLLAGTCDDTDTNPGVDVSFSADIRTILSRSPGGCSCHVPTSGDLGAATLIVGLNLGSLESLREGGVTSGERIVVAGEPCASIMYQKVSEAPPFGSRMPLNGPPYLSVEDRQRLHDWIAEGAIDN
jgi:hypothetical protein